MGPHEKVPREGEVPGGLIAVLWESHAGDVLENNPLPLWTLCHAQQGECCLPRRRRGQGACSRHGDRGESTEVRYFFTKEIKLNSEYVFYF